MFKAVGYESKRRAIAARLLVCLLPVGALLGGGVASAAADPPKAPRLLETDPTSSPAATASSTTPKVFGEAEPKEEIITDGLPSGGWWSTTAVVNPTKHPTFEIQIFSGANCPGAPIATGLASELEETGITVPVPANALTTLSALQVNTEEGGSSTCSPPLNYYEGVVPTGSGETTGPGGGSSGGETPANPPAGTGSTPPIGIGNGTPVKARPDAPKIHTEPGGRANNPTPVVSGNASGAGAVSLFANGDCSGAPVAKGTPAQLSQGFAVPVAPNATTEFSALAVGSQHSTCSSPVAYTEDSLAPRTRITMGPGVKTRKRKVTFRFQDVTEDPPGTSFRCKVDKQKWKTCASPFQVKHLKPGHHVLAIKATDLVGNVELKPVKRKFVVVTKSTP
jgi:hypothetical protein